MISTSATAAPVNISKTRHRKGRATYRSETVVLMDGTDIEQVFYLESFKHILI